MENGNLLNQIIQLFSAFFSKGQEPVVSMTVPLDKPAPVVEVTKPEIDWMSPDCKITEHFTVGDACTLHSWNRLANETDGFNDQMKSNMVVLCQKMEEIRAFLGCPMSVHCMFRSQDYNAKVVKAIPNDVHAQGLAIDFDCNSTMTINELHAKLEPVLEQYGLRMEKNTATWCHLDLHPVVHARYFSA